jgi:MFS family permease
LEFTHGIHPEPIQQIGCNSAPAELRGSAFGIFNLTCGISMLLASFVAGYLWQVSAPRAIFFGGTIFAALAAIGVLAYRTKSAVA